jgi:hypothetical protein
MLLQNDSCLTTRIIVTHKSGIRGKVTNNATIYNFFSKIKIQSFKFITPKGKEGFSYQFTK